MNPIKEKKKTIQVILFIITFAVVLIYFVNHTNVIGSFFNKLFSMIFPFLLGCAIAYIINIPMKGYEKALFKNENGKLYKHKRGISMLLAYFSALLVIFIVCFVVVPEVRNTVVGIYHKFPGALDSIKATLLKYTEKYPEVAQNIKNFNIDWTKYEDKITSFFSDNGGVMLSTTVNVFSSIISTVSNIFIAIVFSLYILGTKEKIERHAKMFIYAIFKEKFADELMVLGRISNQTFSRFFTSQFREGIILGTMFVIAMTIFRMPYPLTIGVLIAFTALIPVFGAFIGLFIGCLLILVEAPKMVIWFIVLFFTLQFIENNFIYPKLVGGDVGLSAIWVLLAVLMGGELMGVVGMFVFIPFVSVVYSYTRSIIYRTLENKNIDIDKKIVNDEDVPKPEKHKRPFQKKDKRKASEETENAGKVIQPEKEDNNDK